MPQNLTTRLTHTVIPYSRARSAATSKIALRQLTFFWQTRIGHAFSRCQPLLNCLLFFIGACTAARRPSPYLCLLDLCPGLLEGSEDCQSLANLCIYIGSFALIFAALDGQKSRRIFVALLFPFLLPVGAMAGAAATRVAAAVPIAASNVLMAMIVRGPLYGLTAALLVGLPMIFLYRVRVTPIAGLVLIPSAGEGLFQADGRDPDLVLFVWGYISFLIFTGVFQALLNRFASSRAASRDQQNVDG